MKTDDAHVCVGGQENLGQQGFSTSWRSSQQHPRRSTQPQSSELLWRTHWSLQDTHTAVLSVLTLIRKEWGWTSSNTKHRQPSSNSVTCERTEESSIIKDNKIKGSWLILKLKMLRIHVFTSIAMVSSSRTSCSAPTSSQVTSGTVANPSLLAEGCTLARESWKSDMRMDKPASFSSDRVSVLFSRHSTLHSSPCWTQHITRQGNAEAGNPVESFCIRNAAQQSECGISGLHKNMKQKRGSDAYTCCGWSSTNIFSEDKNFNSLHTEGVSAMWYEPYSCVCHSPQFGSNLCQVQTS